jgi:hypothetical protein
MKDLVGMKQRMNELSISLIDQTYRSLEMGRHATDMKSLVLGRMIIMMPIIKHSNGTPHLDPFKYYQLLYSFIVNGKIFNL